MGYQPKSYDFIMLANHPPSVKAEKMIKQYSKNKGEFVELNFWRITNRYSMMELKKKFKFGDLPCFIVTTQFAKNRTKKCLYYGDDIEAMCREEFQKALRKNAEQKAREQKARNNLRLRSHSIQQTRTRNDTKFNGNRNKHKD